MLKPLVKSLVHLGGYELVPRKYVDGERRCVATLLEDEEVSLVIDVGANAGQFARWIRTVGYRGPILSFEPLTQAHEELSLAAKQDPLWTAAPRMALGGASGEAEINVSQNSASSSLLPMLPAHQQAAPESTYTRTETVAVNRLDDVCPLKPGERPLLKLDVQGYEKSRSGRKCRWSLCTRVNRWPWNCGNIWQAWL